MPPSPLLREALRILRSRGSSYANPVPAKDLASELRVDVSYLKDQMRHLKDQGVVQVRRGPGGGYYLTAIVPELYLNGQRIRSDNPERLVAEAEGVLARQGLVVTRISVDGVAVSGDLAVVLQGHPGQVVEVSACTPKALVLEGIETSREYIPRLVKGLIDCRRWLDAGNYQEAARVFAAACEGLQWVEYMLSGLREWLPERARGLEELWAKRELYHASFGDVAKAWESNDYKTITDFIAYEAIPFLELVGEILAEDVDNTTIEGRHRYGRQ